MTHSTHGYKRRAKIMDNMRFEGVPFPFSGCRNQVRYVRVAGNCGYYCTSKADAVVVAKDRWEYNVWYNEGEGPVLLPKGGPVKLKKAG